MADLQGKPVSPRVTPTPGALRPELDLLGHLREAAEAAQPPEDEGQEASPLRARVLEIGMRAQKVQRAACAASEAMSRLALMEETLLFALEAAREARAARTLPAAVIDGLQTQVDLALNCVDCHARSAAFGGEMLFSGSVSIEMGDQHLELPSLSSGHIGGGWRGDAVFAAVHSGTVEYSQSVASVSSGGPNSLAQWADGAAMALEAGLSQLQRIKGSVEAFYNEKVLPEVGALAVTLANALATGSGGESLDEATALLSHVRDELQQSGLGQATLGDGKSVLRLLE
ncbi:MAG: hypothetical protein J7M19_08290 [Planctomycetes bacterium]|nr:hypothetical protein [Planctomycetota bacterium]